MFKLLKSKKGFSLVELMIVVVIMAILVAVAVPIFNSVTGNAREKTCIDNQRQIMTTLTNLFMGYGISGTGEVVLKCASTGITVDSGDLDTFSGGEVDIEEIRGCFKTLPVCGDENNTITATLQENTDGTVIVSTECSAKDGNTPIHVLDQKS